METGLKASLDQFGKGNRAVAHGVLFVGVHVAKGYVVPVRHKNRIKPKPLIAAGGKPQGARHLPRNHLNMGIRPGQGQDAIKLRGPIGMALHFCF